MKTKYAVELSELAINQIAQLKQCIIEKFNNPNAAERVADRLKAKMGKLSTIPERVVLVEMEPWRSKGVHKYIMGNYIAYFVIDDLSKRVIITAVVLSSRDQKAQLKKADKRGQ